MFTKEGYVPMSRLWPDFRDRFWTLCKKQAFDYFEADRISPRLDFGTALDLCEDAFHHSFDPWPLELVPIKGDILSVDAVLAASGERFLLKATAFESLRISESAEEAGSDGYWLKQMGSAAFTEANEVWLWPKKGGRPDGDAAKEVLFANEFHTLPILFERETYLVATERPPWSSDLLEERYLQNVWLDVRGRSICLSDRSLGAWQRMLSDDAIKTILNELMSGSRPLNDVPANKGGRPNKTLPAAAAYKKLGLAEMKLTHKEEIRLLEAHLETNISPSTLDRAKKILAQKLS